MKSFRLAFLVLFMAAGSPLLGAAPKLNVLFIAVDDLRCELGCYGSKVVQSPNIDRLAASGVAFTRAYCQQAVCNPSRASVLTGLRPDSTKVWDLVTPLRSTVPDVVTLPQYFKQQGYFTVGLGKIYHNTFPDPQSWSVPETKPKGTAVWSADAQRQLAQFKQQMRRAGKSQKQIDRMRGPATEAEDVPDTRRIDGALAELAVRQLRELKSREEPWFLAVGFILPHLPFTAPKKYWDLYDPAKIVLASNPFLPKGSPPPAMGGMYELRDYMDFTHAKDPPAVLTEAEQRRLKHGYYAAASFTDAQIGRLLDELNALGLEGETAVVLWSDHGWKLGEHAGWCKQTNYELDTRSPLIVRFPGANGNGSPSDALVEFVDIYPTLCDLAGLPISPTLEGRSFKRVLDRPEAKFKDAAFSQFPRKVAGRELMGYAVRTAQYRYVEWLDRATGKLEAAELYDEQADADENTNIAAAPAHAETMRRLSDRLWQNFAKPRTDTAPADEATAPRRP